MAALSSHTMIECNYISEVLDINNKLDLYLLEDVEVMRIIRNVHTEEQSNDLSVPFPT